MPGAAGDERQVGLVTAYCSAFLDCRADGTYGPDMRKHRGCYVCVTTDGTCDHRPRRLPGLAYRPGHCACASVLPPTMFEPIEDATPPRLSRLSIRSVSVAVATAGMAAAAVVASGAVL